MIAPALSSLLSLSLSPTFFTCKVTILLCSIFQMSNMVMSESEIVELSAKIQQQEIENAALDKRQHELQAGLEEDEKHIVRKLAILMKWLYDEEEKAKNLRANISSLKIKRQNLQQQEHMIKLVLIIGFYSSQLIVSTFWFLMYIDTPIDWILYVVHWCLFHYLLVKTVICFLKRLGQEEGKPIFFSAVQYLLINYSFL